MSLYFGKYSKELVFQSFEQVWKGVKVSQYFGQV